MYYIALYCSTLDILSLYLVRLSGYQDQEAYFYYYTDIKCSMKQSQNEICLCSAPAERTVLAAPRDSSTVVLLGLIPQ